MIVLNNFSIEFVRCFRIIRTDSEFGCAGIIQKTCPDKVHHRIGSVGRKALHYANICVEVAFGPPFVFMINYFCSDFRSQTVENGICPVHFES